MSQWTTRLAWAVGLVVLALGPISAGAQDRTKAAAKSVEPAREAATKAPSPAKAGEPAKRAEPAKEGNDIRLAEKAEKAKASAPLKAEDALMKAEAHYELGVMHHERMFESLELAITEYERAIQVKPDFAEAHFNLGLSYHTKAKLGIDDQKLYRKALEEYKLYLKHSPQGEWADKAKQNIRAVEARLQGGAPTKSR